MPKEKAMSEKKRHPSSPDVDTGHATGPTSVEGLEASELPDNEERGSVDTDPRRVVRRKLTSKTGGAIGGGGGGGGGGGSRGGGGGVGVGGGGGGVGAGVVRAGL